MAFATAMISKIATIGIIIKDVPISVAISANPRVELFTSMEKGGHWNGGNPEATVPVIAKGILPL